MKELSYAKSKKIEEGEEKQKTCCICKKKYLGFGNNALPLKRGRCCDDCNRLVVSDRIKKSMLRFVNK